MGVRLERVQDLWAAIAAAETPLAVAKTVCRRRSRTRASPSRLYTILETCKLHDLEPSAYLHAAVITADRGELLLPWQFAAQA